MNALSNMFTNELGGCPADIGADFANLYVSQCNGK
jgi:hypothetical protein